MRRKSGTAWSVAASSCDRAGCCPARRWTTAPPARYTPVRIPAVRSASEAMRWSRSLNEAVRRVKYSTMANAASVSASAVEYHAVSRPRIVSISRFHHVADATDGMDQFRLAAGVDFLAEPGDHHVHDVRAGIEVVVPGVLGDQRPRHDAALVTGEVLEGCVLLGRQLDRLAVAPHLPAAGIERHGGHLEHGQRHRLGTPPQRLDPGLGHLHPERLGV